MAVIAIEEHFTSPELRKLIAPRDRSDPEDARRR